MEIFRFEKTANMVASRILNIKKGERILIITDTDRPRTITEALAYSASSYGGELIIVIMNPQNVGGEEPPAPVAAAMKEADVIINQATFSLTHTLATREALRKGARIANLRNLDEEMFLIGGVSANYDKVREFSEKLSDILTNINKIRLITPEGTDLIMYTKSRKGIAQTGFATQPGQFSGLPDGEATIAPLEGQSEGVIKNPYIADIIGVIDEPFELIVKNGRIDKIKGGKQADALKRLIKERNKNANAIASQFAMGTNPSCRIIPNTREISKKLGTAHIAIGDNLSLYGKMKSNMHIDLVFLKPTLFFNEKCIMKNGELKI